MTRRDDTATVSIWLFIACFMGCSLGTGCGLYVYQTVQERRAEQNVERALDKFMRDLKKIPR